MTLTSCCSGRLYYCPQVRRLECPLHVDTPCCAQPDWHVPLTDIVTGYRPRIGPREPVLPHLIRYFEERTELGEERYGEPLTTFNGRNPAIDYFEELADGIQYRAQELIEMLGRLPHGHGADGQEP